MGFSLTHLLILLVVVILIFGTKKIANLGKDLGQAVKGFKDGVKDGTQDSAQQAAAQEKTPAVTNDPQVVDIAAKEVNTEKK